MPGAELHDWYDKHNTVNRYLASLGSTNLNVRKKPWSEGPYGRESQAIHAFAPRRNLLTTDATARRLVEITTGRAITLPRAAAMLELMKRDLSAPPADADAPGWFSGPALPPGTRFWSKAGWTSDTGHHAFYALRPDGR